MTVVTRLTVTHKYLVLFCLALIYIRMWLTGLQAPTVSFCQCFCVILFNMMATRDNLKSIAIIA